MVKFNLFEFATTTDKKKKGQKRKTLRDEPFL